MDLLNIVIGLFVVLLMIGARGAYLQAEREGQVAARLYSYMLYWQSWMIENDVFSIFDLGVEWNNEIKECIAGGESSTTLLILKKEKKKQIAEIREALEEEYLHIDIDKIKKRLKRLPANSIEYILRHSDRFEQNLHECRTLLSDQDVAVLGSHYVRLCIDMKMQLVSLNRKAVEVIIAVITSLDNYSIKENSKEISDIVWIGLLVSRNIDELLKLTQQLMKKSLFRRTLENMWVIRAPLSPEI